MDTAISYFTLSAYTAYAVLAVLVYDWVLCLGEEARLIWNLPSRVNASSLVYVLSRYVLLIRALGGIVNIYPVSNLLFVTYLGVIRALRWLSIVTGFLSELSFVTFSALRAYALSNRNIWLVTIITILALSPIALNISVATAVVFVDLPSPLNCQGRGSLPLDSTAWRIIGAKNMKYRSYVMLTVSFADMLLGDGTRFMSELLVLAITWWYTYQSYRILKDSMKLRKSILSVLVYNGSIYFLCIAPFCIWAIIFDTVPLEEPIVLEFLFIDFPDPITSILICRFILALRRFDSGSDSEVSSSSLRVQWLQTQRHLQGNTASTSGVLQFAARPSDTLPTFIQSFGHPVHVDDLLEEMEIDLETIIDCQPRCDGEA